MVVPWGLLWVSIIKRHWHALPFKTILKSFCFFTVIISPSYLQARRGGWGDGGRQGGCRRGGQAGGRAGGGGASRRCAAQQLCLAKRRWGPGSPPKACVRGWKQSQRPSRAQHRPAPLPPTCSLQLARPSPLLVQLLLGKERYIRRRHWIVTLAKTAYIAHSGGVSLREPRSARCRRSCAARAGGLAGTAADSRSTGSTAPLPALPAHPKPTLTPPQPPPQPPPLPKQGLYRDGLMTVDNTLLGAANLFVRLAVGSRTLFWLVLAFGYQLPPHLQVGAGCCVLGAGCGAACFVVTVL